MARKFPSGIDVQNQRVLGVADPTANTDGANKQYVDNVARGIFWKQPVRAASTASVSLTAPGATLDGVTLTTGDRILLKDQTAGAENGIYTWTGSGATLTRTADADNGTELNPGTAVTVIAGTVNGDKVYLITSDAAVTIGTTASTWGQLGGGTTYSAGSGLLLAGSVFSLDTAIAVRKYTQAIGDGTSTSIAVTHNLGTRDVQVQVRDATSYERVEPDDVATNANVVTLTFGTAPTTGQYRVIVQG